MVCAGSEPGAEELWNRFAEPQCKRLLNPLGPTLWTSARPVRKGLRLSSCSQSDVCDVLVTGTCQRERLLLLIPSQPRVRVFAPSTAFPAALHCYIVAREIQNGLVHANAISPAIATKVEWRTFAQDVQHRPQSVGVHGRVGLSRILLINISQKKALEEPTRGYTLHYQGDASGMLNINL